MKSNTDRNWIKVFSQRRYLMSLCGPEFVLHQREFHIVGILQKGELTFHHREKNYRFLVGDCVFVPAGELHAFSVNGDAESLIAFHYIDTVEAIQAGFGLLAPKIELLTSTNALVKQFTPFLFDNIDTPLCEQSYKDWLSDLWVSLCRRYEALLRTNMVELELMINAKEYICKNLDGRFDIQEVASHCGLNKNQMSRKFRQLFGISLFQYIHACRMVRAKDLLSRGEAISAVAIELEYSDQAHFTRTFKRYVGISPGEWVKLCNP